MISKSPPNIWMFSESGKDFQYENMIEEVIILNY